MKRKISLFIAAVMMMSTMGAMNAFAATKNTIPVPATSVSDDMSWKNASTSAMPYLVVGQDSNQGVLTQGSKFMVSLDNAEWDFGDGTAGSAGVTSFGAGTEFIFPGLSVTTAAVSLTGINVAGPKGTLYVPALGGDFGSGNSMEYVATFLSNKEAEITVGTPAAAGFNNSIYLPLMTKMKGAGAATITVTDYTNSGVYNQTLTYATSTEGDIVITSLDPNKQTAKTLDLGTIRLDETVAGKMKLTTGAQGTILFDAPSGFKWVDTTPSGSQAITTAAVFFGGFSVSAGALTWGYSSERITLTVPANYLKNTTNRGSVQVSGLRLVKDGASMGDINMNVRVNSLASKMIKVGELVKKNVSLTVDESKTVPEIVNGKFYDAREAQEEQVLDVTIDEGIAGAWKTSTIIGDMAVLKANPEVKIKAARVIKETKISNMAKDDAVFQSYRGSLGAATSGVSNIRTAGALAINDDGELEITAQRQGNDTMELTLRLFVTVKPGYTGDITITTDDEDTDALPTDLSAVVGKAIDPLTVKAETTKVDIGFMDTPLNDITITENVAGAMVEVTNKDGYGGVGSSGSWTPNSEFSKLLLWLGSNTNVGFNAEAAKAEVVSGDIVIDGLDQGNVTHRDGVEGLILKIKRDSNTASEIKITGAAVDTSRSLPKGKIDLRMGGMVVANSTYTSTIGSKVDTDWSGFDVDYVTAVKEYIELTDKDNLGMSNPTSGGTVTNHKEVAVKIGTNEMTIDGEAVTTDAPSFQVGGVSYLPLRAVGKAFGLADGQFDFNYNMQTVTVSGTPYGTVQFKINSNSYIMEGVQRGMDNGATAKLVQGRTFLPLRVLGEKVFNGTVDYDAASQTAYINKKAQ